MFRFTKTFDRRRWQRSLLEALAQYFTITVTMWLLLAWRARSQSFAYLWPLTGIQLAMILRDWREPRERYLQLFAGTAGIATASCLLSLPWWMATAYTIVHGGEVWFAAALLSPHVTRFAELKKRKNVLFLGLVAIVVPVSGGLTLGVPLARWTHHWLLQTTLLTAMADSVGILMVTPALLFLLTGGFADLNRLRPYLKIGLPGVVGFVIATILVFSQNTNPLLYLVFPAMVITLFMFGLEGATFVSVAVTAIACWQTAHGRGPIWVMNDATMEHRIGALQCFLWMVAAVAMPVGAMLDERRSAELRAGQSQSIYRTLLQHSEDMIVLSALDGSERFVSPGVKRVTGWTPEEYLALDRKGGIHPDDRDLVQAAMDSFAKGRMAQILRFRMARKDGGHCWVEANAIAYTGPPSNAVVGYVVTIRDISGLVTEEGRWLSEKAALTHQNETLADLAATDELTRISNRRTFNRTIDYEAARHARSGHSLSLLIVDVDHFKLYNDLYGHPAGDECLRRIAATLQSTVGRVSDAVARVGGEEFALILPGTDCDGALLVAEDILEKVRGLNMKHGRSSQGQVSVSIGIATWPPFFVSEVAELINQADLALYRSKKCGRNGVTASTAFSHAAVGAADPGSNI